MSEHRPFVRRIDAATAVFCLIASLSATAASVTVTNTAVGGNTYQFDYTVTTAPGDPTLTEFTVYLDLTFTDFANPLAISGGTAIVVPPSPLLGTGANNGDGFYDVILPGSGLAPGSTLTGLSFEANYTGLGSPSAPPYYTFVNAANNYAVVQSGYASVLAAPQVPVTVSGSTISSGQSASLTATPSGAGPFAYQWYQGVSGNVASPVAGATGAQFTTPPLSTTSSYTLPIVSSNTSVGVITTSPLVFTGGVANLSTAFQPTGNGSTTISINTPAPYSTPTGSLSSEYYPSVAVSVAPASIYVGASSVTVGSNLQTSAYSYLQATPAQPVWLIASSSNSSLVQISLSETAAGAGSAATSALTNPSGTFWFQGQNGVTANMPQTATVTFCVVPYVSGSQPPTTCPSGTSADFAPVVVPVTVNPSGFVIASGNFTTSPGAADTAIVIKTAVLETSSGLSNYQTTQELRAGIVVPLDVDVSPSSGNAQTCSNGIGSMAVSPLYAEQGVGSLDDNFVPTSNSNASGTCAISVSVDAGSTWSFTKPGTSGTYTPTVVATVN